MTDHDVAMYDRTLIKALTADNDKLRAEVERLKADVHFWRHHAEQRLIALRETEAELRDLKP